MEQKKKNNIMLGLIYLIIYVAYCVTVFLVFSQRNRVFWVSFCFFTVIYVLHMLSIFDIINIPNLKLRFTSFPFGAFSMILLLTELAVSITFMALRNRVGVKTAVVIQTLLLCVLAAAWFASVMARDSVRNVSAKSAGNTNSMKRVQSEIEILLQKSTDGEAAAALKRLSETVRYSDPVSNPAVMKQEQSIMQCIGELREAFEAGESARVRDLCSRTEELFMERNKILIISK